MERMLAEESPGFRQDWCQQQPWKEQGRELDANKLRREIASREGGDCNARRATRHLGAIRVTNPRSLNA